MKAYRLHSCTETFVSLFVVVVCVVVLFLIFASEVGIPAGQRLFTLLNIQF